MWKQRKLDAEAEGKHSEKRSDKRRKENPPSQKSGEHEPGYWNKKLMELKEKDTSRLVKFGLHFIELYLNSYGFITLYTAI